MKNTLIISLHEDELHEVFLKDFKIHTCVVAPGCHAGQLAFDMFSTILFNLRKR